MLWWEKELMKKVGDVKIIPGKEGFFTAQASCDGFGVEKYTYPKKESVYKNKIVETER